MPLSWASDWRYMRPTSCSSGVRATSRFRRGWVSIWTSAYGANASPHWPSASSARLAAGTATRVKVSSPRSRGRTSTLPNASALAPVHAPYGGNHQGQGQGTKEREDEGEFHRSGEGLRHPAMQGSCP